MTGGLVGLLLAAGTCAVTVIPASPASADAVRDQEMWVLDMVHAPAAWPITQGQHVIVAVIDSGVFPSVSDLAGSVIKGPDLSGVTTPQSDTSWGVHGTWMASLIAGHGHGDGSSGIEGVAPASHVLSIRVVTGLVRREFGQIVVHEAMHAWLVQHRFPSLPEPLCEGLCQAMSYRYIRRHMAEPRARLMARHIRESPDPVYGGGFRAVRASALEHGFENVIDHVRRTGRLP